MAGIEAAQRRHRLQAAIDDAKKNRKDITRDEMMTIWGVSPGRLTQILNQIPGFPAAKDIKGKLYFPRGRALKALWEWEHKGDREQQEKQKRLAAIMGVEQDTSALTHLHPGEMLKAMQANAEIQERIKSQGMLVSRADAQAVAVRVYELLSRRLSNLGTVIDPNGLLSPDQREKMDKAGSDLLLSIYAQMRDTLSDHEPDPADGPVLSRRANAGAGSVPISGARR